MTCREPAVTESQARTLTRPGHGNPHLIWDGTRFRVITRGFYDAHDAGRPRWVLILTRDDLAEVDPDALDGNPAALAELLTMYAYETTDEIPDPGTA